LILPIDKSGKVPQLAPVLAKITSKRQVTFPATVLAALGVGPGDRLEILESPEGFILRPRRVDRSKLAPLRGTLQPGAVAFDLHSFRSHPHEPALRD
jgi:AbrB family looped-hinge helix DNA binding protein